VSNFFVRNKWNMHPKTKKFSCLKTNFQVETLTKEHGKRGGDSPWVRHTTAKVGVPCLPYFLFLLFLSILLTFQVFYLNKRTFGMNFNQMTETHNLNLITCRKGIFCLFFN
jgi:hypothetical protein